MNDLRCQQDGGDYEALRSQAAQASPAQGSALLPRGLAVWLRDPSPDARPLLPQPPAEIPPTEIFGCGALPAAVASIVQRLAREAAHA